MKNLLIKLLGKIQYCKYFHTSYGTAVKYQYQCDKCKLEHTM